MISFLPCKSLSLFIQLQKGFFVFLSSAVILLGYDMASVILGQYSQVCCLVFQNVVLNNFFVFLESFLELSFIYSVLLLKFLQRPLISLCQIGFAYFQLLFIFNFLNFFLTIFLFLTFYFFQGTTCCVQLLLFSFWFCIQF